MSLSYKCEECGLGADVVIKGDDGIQRCGPCDFRQPVRKPTEQKSGGGEVVDEKKQCDYTGHEFGASYPDSMCIDGLLWDADSCDDPGGPLTIGGDRPCPKCNREQWLSDRMELLEEELDGTRDELKEAREKLGTLGISWTQEMVGRQTAERNWEVALERVAVLANINHDCP